jgi:hypothetical protein
VKTAGKTYMAFQGTSLLAAGTAEEVLPVLKSRFDRDRGAVVLVFEDQTGRQVDFDLRGTLENVLARYRPAPARVGPGRPKLGVVAREVSLLPRHWEWLEQQPSGASAAIRRLVEEARKQNPDEQQARAAIAATDRFLSAIAGNLPGYEEACRALYARKRKRFDELIREWPRDIRLCAQRLVLGVLM